MLWKIVGVSVCCVIVGLIVKQYRPEVATLVNICGGLIIFMLVIDGAKSVIENFVSIQDSSGIKLDVVTPVLKVVGVGYVTEFASDLAEETGNKSIANKVILGGKIAICVLALPVIKNLLHAIFSLI